MMDGLIRDLFFAVIYGFVSPEMPGFLCTSLDEAWDCMLSFGFMFLQTCSHTPTPDTRYGLRMMYSCSR